MKKSVLLLTVALLLSGCKSTTQIAQEIVNSEETAVTTTENAISITNPLEMNILDENPDMSGYIWLAHSEVFQEISFDESIRFLEEGGTGILFYGAEWCNFCQRAVVELGQQASDAGVTVYYVSLTDRSVDMDEITRLCEKFDWMEWTEEDGERLPNFQIPEVIAVKNGEIQGHHLSLVDDFVITDANSQMNADQKKVLRAIYNELFLSIAD